MSWIYGASLEEWHHWAETLGLAEHLLPVVANPGATISPDSNMKALGKTPSRYNFRGEVAGFAKWTENRTTLKEIAKWETDERQAYGICIQSREGSLRALDIDVSQKLLSRQIVKAIETALPLHVWTPRTREGTGKLLLPFRYEGPLTKHVLEVEGGIIEVLGDGQQWIADSTYINGKGKADGRYLWPVGRPASIDDVPLLTEAEFADLVATLEIMFDVGDGWSIARQRREGAGTYVGPPIDDPVAQWILEGKWEMKDESHGNKGELLIRCPFDNEHTSDSGPTETVYFPAGTGGYKRGHFKCLHAHCMARTDDDYIRAIGFDISDEFPLLDGPSGDEVGGEGERAASLPVPVAPKFITNHKGAKENRVYNHELFIQHPRLCGMQIAWDNFTASIVWCPAADKPGEERWRAFGDEHYARIVRQMDRNGFVPQSASTVRPAVYSVAKQRQIDTAIEWSMRLPEWDGMPRVESFLVDYFKALDTPYSRALGRYMWTAQAGRLLDPGCQVDMVPIFVSPQGTRKTSAIAALAPASSMFTDINLMERDGDTIRKMRGKLVIELDELRGLRGRTAEDVKSFITRREEEWVPKYQEFTKTFRRRFLMYGSTNDDDFLGDPTGERRYLPLNVASTGQIAVDRIERDRLQLWAEGIARWQLNGVEWKDAQDLAPLEHDKFKSTDAWAPLVAAWVLQTGGLESPDLAPADRPYQWGIADALAGAVNISAAKSTKGDEMRMSKVLQSLGGMKRKTNGYLRWHVNREDALLRIPSVHRGHERTYDRGDAGAP